MWMLTIRCFDVLIELNLGSGIETAMGCRK